MPAKNLPENSERVTGWSGERTHRLVGSRRPTIPDILRVDLAFHRLLLEAAGNSLLKERAGFIYLIIEFQLVSPFYSNAKGKLGLSQHLSIIEAILREDLISAERFLLDHLRSAKGIFCAIVRQTRKSIPSGSSSGGPTG